MTATAGKSIHGSAVLVGDRAVLIRGPSGAGKSRLALDLILAGGTGQLPSAILVGDDRVHLEVRRDQLYVRPSPRLAGLIEVRGLGIRRSSFVPEANIGLVVDLSAGDSGRQPTPEALFTIIQGVRLPRIPVGEGYPALPLVLGAFKTTPATGLHVIA